jgi:L-lactate dehydrogenase
MKIGVIGSGFVGATAAYAMVMRGVGREIVLVDLNKERAQAEADDILHAVPFSHPLEVSAGDYEQLKDARLVIVSAGASQKPGETRLELLGRNAEVFKQIIPRVLEYAPEAVLLIATNPVDIMTHIAAHIAKDFSVPASRVLGTGTSLDTARFRALLGRHIGVDPQHIHAYVLGEHGDSEVLTWSLVTISGIPLQEFCGLQNLSICAEDRQRIEEQVRFAAYHIIEGKQATYYGIGSAIARIAEIILKNQRSIMTVCTPIDAIYSIPNITLSLPNLIGGTGIQTTLEPSIDQKERQSLIQSAQIIKEAINNLI